MNVRVVGETARGVLSNSSWNLVAFGAGLAAQFVTVPLVVRWIGLDAFGAAAVVLAICAPLTLVGTVLSQALIRELSSCSDPCLQRESLIALTSTAMRWCVLACAVGWGILAALGPTIARTLFSDVATVNIIWPALMLGAAGVVAQQIGLVLQGISASQQDYRTIARITLWTALTNCTLTLGITWLWPSLLGYLAGVSAGCALIALVWYQRWRMLVSWRDVLSKRASQEGSVLLLFSRWQGLAQISGVFGNQIDRYTLGAMAPVSVVGQYTVANRLQEAVYIGVIKAGEVLFPRFGSMASHSNEDRLRFFQLASWALGTTSASLLVPLAVLSNGVLTLWVGTDVARGADQILFVLVLGGVVGSASNVFTYYAMGMGLNKPVAGVSVLYSTLTVMSTVVLIAAFGSAAAGTGLLIASVARMAISLTLTKRLFFASVQWSALLVSTALPVLVGFGVALACQRLFNFPPVDWVHLSFQYGTLSALVLVVCVLATGATSSGRHLIAQLILALRNHRP